MKKLVLICLIGRMGWAGDIGKLELGGYLENNLSVLVSDSGYLSDQSNLRVEGTWDFGKKGGIETHLILSYALQPLDPFANFKSGSLMENIFTRYAAGFYQQWDEFYNALTDSQKKIVDNLASSLDPGALDYIPYTSFYPKDQVTLDRALLKLYFKRFDLYLGKQMMAWGTGYAFNPTDVWNAKNPVDPTASRVGVKALRLEIPYGSVSGISLVLLPGKDLDRTSFGARLKHNVKGFDMSVSGMRIMNADRMLLGLRPLAMAGLDLAGQLGEVGVWMETAISNPHYTGNKYTNIDSLYVQLDAGLDYTFKNGLYVMGEYYYNGLGQKQWKDYNLQDLLNLMAGDMAGLGQHYIMTGVTKAVFDDYNLTGFILANITDQSAMFLPGVEYTFSDDISVNLSGQIGVGNKKQSEYGSVYSTVLLKATGYF